MVTENAGTVGARCVTGGAAAVPVKRELAESAGGGQAVVLGVHQPGATTSCTALHTAILITPLVSQLYSQCSRVRRLSSAASAISSGGRQLCQQHSVKVSCGVRCYHNHNTAVVMRCPPQPRLPTTTVTTLSSCATPCRDLDMTHAAPPEHSQHGRQQYRERESGQMQGCSQEFSL